MAARVCLCLQFASTSVTLFGKQCKVVTRSWWKLLTYIVVRVRSYRFSFQPLGWNFNNAASYVSPTQRWPTSCKFNHVRHCTGPESGRMEKQTTIATQQLQFCEYSSIKLLRHTLFVSKLLHNSFHLNFLVSRGNCAVADRRCRSYYNIYDNLS